MSRLHTGALGRFSGLMNRAGRSPAVMQARSEEFRDRPTRDRHLPPALKSQHRAAPARGVRRVLAAHLALLAFCAAASAETVRHDPNAQRFGRARTTSFGLDVTFTVENAPAPGGQIDLSINMAPAVGYDRLAVAFQANGNIALAAPMDQEFLDVQSGVPIEIGGTLDITTTGSGELVVQVGSFRDTSCGEKPQHEEFFRFFVLDDGTAVYTGTGDLINVEAERIADMYSNGVITQEEAEAQADALLAAPLNPEDEGSGRMTVLGGERGTVTVQGTARWTDVEGNRHPCRNVEVVARGSLGSTLASTNTNASGSFSMTFDPGGSGPHSFAIRVNARNDAAQVRNALIIPILGGSTYHYQRSFSGVSDGGMLLGQQFTIGNIGSAAQAFSIADAVIEGSELIGTLEGQSPPRIDVNWPTSGSFYDVIGRDSIQIGRNQAYSWDVILHEYGHYVADRGVLNCWDCWTYHLLLEHCTHYSHRDMIEEYNKEEGTKLAWQEGLATYFDMAAQDMGNTGALGIPYSGTGDFSYDHVVSVGDEGFENEQADASGNARDIRPGINYQGPIKDTYTKDGDSSCDPAVPLRDVWFAYTPATSGQASLDACLIHFAPTDLPTFSVHTGSPGTTSNEVACSNSACLAPLTFSVTAGTKYWIRVAATGPGEDYYYITLSGPNCQGCTDGGNILDYTALHDDLEDETSPGGVDKGEGNELTVSRILWDLADPANETLDDVAMGHGTLWNTLVAAPVSGGCNAGTSRYLTLSDFWNELAGGATHAQKLNYGGVFERNGVAPKPTSANVTSAGAAPTFNWDTTEKLNQFRVRLYDEQFVQILESAPQTVNLDPATGMYKKNAFWQPSPAEWQSIYDITTSGLVYWAVEGENTDDFVTGPYLSGARTLGVATGGNVDIAFIVDVSGSMTEELEAVKAALACVITTNGIGANGIGTNGVGTNGFDLNTTGLCTGGILQGRCTGCTTPVQTTTATYFRLTTFADAADVIVPGTANIFGAGHAVPPSPGGAGGGTLPPEFVLPSGTGRILTFSDTEGWVSCGCPSPDPPFPPSNASDADGGNCASGTTDITSYGGISGIINNDASMFLCGVFVGPGEPVDPAPARLDFTGNMDFVELAPELNQTFFIGDGRTGAGVVQRFLVPDGATRFYMGFADALEFGNPTSPPGYYFDNCGEITTKYPLASPSNATCCNKTILDEIAALTPGGENGCGEPSVLALINGTTDLKPGGTVYFATDEPSYTGSSLDAAIAALRVRGAKVHVLLSGECVPPGGPRETDPEGAFGAFSRLADETGGSFSFLPDVDAQYAYTTANVVQAAVNPTVVRVTPARLERGTVARLTIQGDGTNFNAGSTLTIAGTGIVVTAVVAESPTLLTAMVAATPEAPLGRVDVEVITPLAQGVAEVARGSGVMDVEPADSEPRLVSITPAVVAAGQMLDLEIRGAGTHFDGTSAPDLGPDFTVHLVEALCPTGLRVNVSVDPLAIAELAIPVVTTGAETAFAASEDLLRVRAASAAPPATLTIEPPLGRTGETVAIRIVLDGLVLSQAEAAAAEVLFTPEDVTAVGPIEVCGGDTFDLRAIIGNDAALGFHDVAVVTSNGTAAALAAFQVLADDVDCNSNGNPDADDIATAFSLDCDSNGVPDECQADCNNNGSADVCDVLAAVSADCNCNLFPDECETGDAFDCNSNGVPDDCDLASAASFDCNVNGIPDECDIARGVSRDCNGNTIPDSCDIAAGTAEDCDGNAYLDSCELAAGTASDCNTNGTPDVCDMTAGLDTDCDGNGVLDGCDLAAGAADCQPNGVLDACELAGSGSSFSADHAEQNAAQWTSWTEDGEVTLFDDTDFKRFGQGSIRMEVTGGFDNYARYPANADAAWNLSGLQGIRVWFYAINPNQPGFQNQSPRIRLGDADGYFEWRPGFDILDLARDQWVEFVIPANGDATWQRLTVGSPDLARIDYIQIHADTWGAGFTLWIDGLRMEPNSFEGSLDCNSNGVPDECDLAQGAPDCDGDGIPDVCQETVDCNSNGIHDPCELLAGSATDCDADDVLDECQPSVAPTLLYAVSGEDDVLYTVDPIDGALSPVGPMTLEPYFVYQGDALSRHPASNVFYAVLDVDSDSNGFGLALVTIDPGTAAFTLVGFLNEPVRDIAFRDDGTLYGVSGNAPASQELVTIDTGDASVTSLEYTLETPGEHAIAFAPGSGSLYALGSEYSPIPRTILKRIDVDVLAAEEIVGEYDAVLSPQALAFHPGGAIIYAFGYDDNDEGLWRIEPTTGLILGKAQMFDAIPAGAAFAVGDCNANGIPDHCEADCNSNGTPDDCDLAVGELDCDANGILDICETLDGVVRDCNTNGLVDHCEIRVGSGADCNGNGTLDACDIAGGTSEDCDRNGIPDECGPGMGLAAAYYDNIDFTGPTVARIDPTIDFDWGGGSPDPAIDAETFSARWTGRLNAPYGETYTFHTTTDDGVRLWVDGQLIIDQWIDQGPTEWSGMIDLEGGTWYDLRVDYYENGGGAMAQLRWSSPSIAYAIVPPERLSPPISDCNGNGVADLCDIAAGTSIDCDGNDRPDECDLAGGTGQDCNSNGVLDACELFSVRIDESFENGLPVEWLLGSMWRLTGQCAQTNACDPPTWAYYGQDASCTFDNGETTAGAMVTPPVFLPPDTTVTLSYCSVYAGEDGDSNQSGYDWAWVSVNGVEVDDVSQAGSRGDWELRSVDLSGFAGQLVTISWQFDSVDNISNDTLGWQVDEIRLVVDDGGGDCNGNSVLDECDITSGFSSDVNSNGVPDECDAPGDCDGDGDVDLDDFAAFEPCLAGPDGGMDPGCACFDTDASGTIDLRDFAMFQSAFTG